jgi:hypothetical protein
MANEPSGPDRRSYLKYAGTAALVGLAGCSGDGGDGGNGGTPTPSPEPDDTPAPSHESPHDAELSDAEATGDSLGGGSRSPDAVVPADDPSVMLQHEPNQGQYCGNCALFVPDQNDDGFGACASVEGTIHPCDFCLLYTEHGGEDTVPCE